MDTGTVCYSTRLYNATLIYLIAYLAIELVFWLVLYVFLFKGYYQNDQRLPEPYRGYRPGDRHKLLLRILKRLERTHKARLVVARDDDSISRDSKTSATWSDSDEDNDNDDDSVKRYIISHLNNWFQDTPETKTFTPRETTKDEALQDVPSKEEMDLFFAWAFFGLDLPDLVDWMKLELQLMHDLFKERYGIQFSQPSRPKRRRIKKPMRLTIDPLKPTYRPLILYILFAIIKLVGSIVLRFAGFSYHTTSTGLSYWYRPASTDKQENDGKQEHTRQELPILFFHGIAPGGVALYLPFLLCGLGANWISSNDTKKHTCNNSNDDEDYGNDGTSTDKVRCSNRPALFLFENPAISLGLTQRAPNEMETTVGAWEAVETQLGTISNGSGVSVMGHSFGSCPVTWMIHSKYAHHIHQIVLLDPVSVLLSDPDVVVNFVYGGKKRQSDNHQSSSVFSRNNSNDGKKKTKKPPGIVANEFFLEYYLRRHFFWYNCELWLEDIPPTCRHVIIGVAEEDDVLDGRKVKQEVELFFRSHPRYEFCANQPLTADTQIAVPTAVPLVTTKHEDKSPLSAPLVFRKDMSMSPFPSSTSSSSSCSSTSISSLSLPPPSSSEPTANTTIIQKAKSDLIYWEGKGHGFCITNRNVWTQIKFLVQEGARKK